MKQVWKLMLPFVVLFCGCGGGDSTVTPVDPTVRSVPRTYAGLELVLALSKGVYAKGETITFTTLIKNTASTTVGLRLKTNIFADAAQVAVYDKNNVLVSLIPKAPEPSLVDLSLTPGFTTVYASPWDQTNGTTGLQIPPGEYHAEMHLLLAAINFVDVTPADLAGLRSETITFTVQ